MYRVNVTNSSPFTRGTTHYFKDIVIQQNGFPRRLGINVTAQPANTLEINSTVANQSGLRLANLTSGAVPVINPGLGVLTVDQNGDVIYVQDNPPSTSLGNLCTDPQNPLTGDYEVPLNGFNFYFSNQGTPNDKVGIGYNCSTPLLGKLSVLESAGNIAGDFVANSGGSNIGVNLVVNTGANNTGAQAIVSGGGVAYGYYADVFNGTVITSGVDAKATIIKRAM